MSEGISTPAGEGAHAPESGGLPAQSIPAARRFFMVEYADELRRGFAWLRSSPRPEQSVLARVNKGFRKWAKGRKSRIGAAVVVLIMAASYGLFAVQAGSTEYLEGLGPLGPGPTGNNATVTMQGTVQQDGAEHVDVEVSVARVAALTVTLTWTDEDPPVAWVQNQPDELGFNVTAPSGESWTAPMKTSGLVTWTLPDTARSYGAGNWGIEVQGGNMGDNVPLAFPSRPCGVCSADNSNAWALKVEYAW